MINLKEIIKKTLIIFFIISICFQNVSAINTWYSKEFGGSLTVEETTTTGGNWVSKSIGGSVTITNNTGFTGWISKSIGGSVTVSGYVYGNWSDYWKMTRISKPVFSNPNPANNSIGNPFSFTWNITINNPDGNNTNWSIECSNGQTNSATEDSNGSKTLSLSGLSASTQYTVWVNASHNKSSNSFTNETFYFNTTSGLSASNPYPSNNSMNVSRSLYNISIDLSDPEGDTLIWSIETAPDIGSNSSSGGNGTKECIVDGNVSSGNISYTWFVNVTDGNNTLNHTYYFNSEFSAPNVTTNSSTGVGLTNATLHGFLVSNGNDSDTTVYFEYGYTTNYGNITSQNPIISDETIYYFDSYSASSFTNPDNMVDGSTSTYADESAGLGYQTLDSHTYSSAPNGRRIVGVHVRIHGKIFSADGNGQVRLTPSFDGNSGSSYNSGIPIDYTYTNADGNPSRDWGDWVDITNDSSAPSDWYWNNISSIDLEVKNDADIGASGSSSQVSLAQVRIIYDIVEFSQEITGISYSSTYHYRAIANNTNSSVYGEDFNFTTLPTSVSSFSASNYNSTSINLSWSDTSGVDSVYIRYSKNNYPSSITDGKFLVNESTNITYNHTGLDWGTGYYYKAWSFNDTSGFGDFTSDVGYTNPKHPSDFQTTSTGMTSITFQVTKGTNATRTVLFMNTTNTNYPNKTNGVEKDNTTSSTLIASGLNGNTSYNFSVYSFNPVSGLWSELNDTTGETTASTSDAPTSISVTRENDTEISLSWIKGSDYTVIFRKEGSYPSTSDTEIYNGTLSSFTDTGLTPASHYYYRFYGWNGESLSSSSNVGDNTTLPSPPVNLSGQISGNDLIIEWIKGTGASRTVIVNNSANYPTDETDGTVQYNDTGITHTVSGVTDINYYVGFSYVLLNGEYLYSEPENMVWGGIEINAYKETDPSVELTNYTVFITNPDGSETYQNTSANNPFRIGVNEVPNGENSIVQVSKDGYYTRTKYEDLYDNVFYQMNFYLPPDEEGSQGGSTDDDDYIPPSDDEDILKSTSQSVSNPSVDLSFNLSCIPSLIVSVQGYNESLYGHWFTIPDDKYSLVAQRITINQSVLDDNTSTVQVNYYCSNNESYANQYLVTIVNEIPEPIDDALVEVSVYVNTTDEYDTIYSVYSDSSGQVDLYLISGTLYKFEISKSGYQTELADWIPSDNKFTKEFTLFGEETDIPDQVLPSEVVSATAEINGTNLNVNFSCSYGVITNTSLYVYEQNVSTDIESLLFSNTTTLTNEWEEIISNINTSNGHRVTIFYNSAIWGLQKITILVNPDYSPPITEDEVDSLFELNYGSNPFGWSNFLLWIFLAILLVKADKEDLGLVLILIGGLALTFSLIIGFNTTISISAGGIIPLLMISLGVLQLWKSKRLST